MRYLFSLILLLNLAFAQKPFEELSHEERMQVAEKEALEAPSDEKFQSLMDKGYQHFIDKEYDAAIRYFEEAKEQRPYNVYPRVNIRDVELAMGKRKKDEMKQDEQQAYRPPVSAKPWGGVVEDKSHEDGKAEPIPAPKENEEVVDNTPKKEPITKPEPKETSKPEVKEEKKPKVVKEEQPKVIKKETKPQFEPKESLSVEEQRKQLAQEYPVGVTEEKFKEGNAQVIRRVVVRGENADDFRQVKQPWGATYYFKNGQSISERIWKAEAFPEE